MIWIDRPDHHFKSDLIALAWRRRFSGKEVGPRSFLPNGRKQYIQFSISTRDKKRYFISVHQAVFFLEGAQIPDGMMIDHINGDIWDNRRCNLRIVTPLQNTINSAPRQNRIDQLPTNVFTRKNRPGFYARITVDGKRIGLGCHKTPELAYQAVLDAAAKHHGEYSRIA